MRSVSVGRSPAITSSSSRSFGSVASARATSSRLRSGSVSAEATGRWTSPHTGADYPSGWRLRLPDGSQLQLTPQLVDQELYFPGAPSDQTMSYWEGAVTVTGDRTGLGYVELTGYALRS